MTHASEIVARVGAALYGDDWAAPLARALGLNERTVRRLKAAALAGAAYPVAPGVLADLKDLVLKRSDNLRLLAKAIDDPLMFAPHGAKRPS